MVNVDKLGMHGGSYQDGRSPSFQWVCYVGMDPENDARGSPWQHELGGSFLVLGIR